MTAHTSTDWKFRTWMALLAAFAWISFASVTTLYTLTKEGPGRCAAYGERHSVADANPIVDLVCIPFRYPF